MLQPPETIARIQFLRQKAAAGQLTPDETREVLNLMRQGRVAAANTSAKARSAKAKPQVNSQDLLDELDNL